MLPTEDEIQLLRALSHPAVCDLFHLATPTL